MSKILTKFELLFFFIFLNTTNSLADNNILIEQYLDKKLDLALHPNCRISYIYQKLDDSDIVENINLVGRSSSNNYKLSIKLSKDGKLHEKIIQLTCQELCPYPVFSKKMDRNTIISHEDVLFGEHKYSSDPNIIIDPHSLYGMRLKRSILPNKLINNLDIVKPLLVKKEQKSWVLYSKNNIAIKLSVIILENGSAKDIVKVKNEKTGFVMLCEVNEDGSLTLKN